TTPATVSTSATSRATTSGRRPSLKFGTHSTMRVHSVMVCITNHDEFRTPPELWEEFFAKSFCPTQARVAVFGLHARLAPYVSKPSRRTHVAARYIAADSSIIPKLPQPQLANRRLRNMPTIVLVVSVAQTNESTTKLRKMRSLRRTTYQRCTT